MQVTRVSTLAVACLAVGASAASAQPLLGDKDVNYTFHLFSDSDNVKVYSHYSDYGMQLGSAWNLGLRWNHEHVVIPAIEAPAGTQEAVDAITTASRPISNTADAFADYVKIRNEMSASVDRGRTSIGYYVSTESDYFAQQLNASYGYDLMDQLTLSVAGSYGWDEIAPLADDDTPGAGGTRTTWNWSAGATGVLGPTTMVRAGAQLYRVGGLQHNPYRNVYAGGANHPELHPDQRWRRDLFLKLHQYFGNRSSLRLTYKLYGDDWGVDSQTLGLKLSQYITSTVAVQYRYRYYTQGGADFYRDEYEDVNGIDGYRTADYRLGDFNAHLFGSRLEWGIGSLISKPKFLRSTRLTLSYERYFNSNNFSANIFESGVTLAF